MALEPVDQTEPSQDAVPSQRFGALLPQVGTVLLVVGVILMLLLHVLPPSNRISPMTRTISEYALGSSGWVFDLGVIALAAGTVAVLVTLVLAGVVRAAGPATVLIILWVLGLLVLVVFQKYNYRLDGGAGAGGTIHRLATLVAFISLPSGGLLAARSGRRTPAWRRSAAWTRWSSLLSWACLGLLFYAIARGIVADVSWWRVFPLGALERLIASAEIVTLFVLARWAGLAAKPIAKGP